jgi:ureidoacrylate peracid hydrolase
MTPQEIAADRTALLVIDMQVDFGAADGAMARQGADITAAQSALEQAEQLVAAARQAGVPVIFVRLLNGAQDLCAEGTHGAEFIGPKPAPGEAVISKSRFSAFAGTGLGEQLHARGINTVVLAGLTTECCVASSAWHAFEQDFRVFIATDACAAYEDGLHAHALCALELSGAVLAETADFRAIWEKFR